jgi:hypothetical protein
MKHLKRFESTSNKTIRHREYRELYKEYFQNMLTSFNNHSIYHGLSEVLGDVIGDSYNDVIYNVDYLEQVKKLFQETKEEFDNLSEVLKDLEEEYEIESVIYNIKPYGKYKQFITHGSEKIPTIRTNPTKIKTNLDTEDVIFDVYIGLSNEKEGTGLYEVIETDKMKGISDFIKILESKGSKIEIVLFTGSVRKQNGDEMRYKSFINLKFNVK